MGNGKDEREEYEDQDAEPTSTAPPGQRPSDTGLRDERTGGAEGRERADSPDAVDTDMEQEGDPNP